MEGRLCGPLFLLVVNVILSAHGEDGEDSARPLLGARTIETTVPCPEKCTCRVNYEFQDSGESVAELSVTCSRSPYKLSRSHPKYENFMSELRTFLREGKDDARREGFIVTTLNITNSPLSSIIPEICAFSNLLRLDLSGNNFKADSLMGNCIYEKLKKLEMLNLNANSITYLKAGTIRLTPELTSIYFNVNGLKIVEPGAIWSPKITDPQQIRKTYIAINLRGNELKSIDSWIFILAANNSINGTCHIRELSFDYSLNKISKGTNLLHATELLDSWYLVPAKTYHGPTCYHDSPYMDLSLNRGIHNPLMIYEGLGLDLTKLEESKKKFIRLGLSYMSTKFYVYAGVTTSPPNAPHMCDCTIFYYYDYLNTSSHIQCQDIHYKGPAFYYPTYSFKTIKRNDLVCDMGTYYNWLKQDYPECSFMQNPASNTIHINCPDAKCGIPQFAPKPLDIKGGPKSVEYNFELTIKDTVVPTIDWRHYYVSLSKLDVSSSGVENISAQVLDTLIRNRATINLSGNPLTKLPSFPKVEEHEQEETDMIEQDVYSLNEDISQMKSYHHFKVYLDRNPWSCECENHETPKFRLWLEKLDKLRILQNPTAIVCGPGRFHNQSILQIHPNRFCEIISEETKLNIIIAASCLFGSFLLALLAYRIMYRYRVKLHAHFGVRFRGEKDECEGEGMEFDAFFSYANEDSEYVEGLARRLEAEGYNIFLHQRDFKLGACIFEEIDRAISNSKRTVCFLSTHFLESKYCVQEFKTAFGTYEKIKRNRLKVVMLEDVDFSSVAATQSHVKIYNYKRSQSKDLMNQIRYALADGKLGGAQEPAKPSYIQDVSYNHDNGETEPLLGSNHYNNLV